MIFSFHLVFYDRKPFSSILTKFNNLSCNKWPHLFHQKFSLLTYDLKKKCTKDLLTNFLYKSFLKLEILRNYWTIFRSSHHRCPIKNANLKNFLIVTGKHLCWGGHFNKVAGLQICNFIKKDSNRYLHVNL